MKVVIYLKRILDIYYLFGKLSPISYFFSDRITKSAYLFKSASLKNSFSSYVFKPDFGNFIFAKSSKVFISGLIN